MYKLNFLYQVNLLSWRLIRQQARYLLWRNIMLCQCAIFTASLIAVLMQARSEQIDRQETVVALSQQQAVLSQYQQQVQLAMAHLQWIKQSFQLYHQARQPARSYSILLQQLSQQIPDSCWLMALRQQGDVLLFDVISRNYASINTFLAILSRQPLLVNVNLQGITQREEGDFRFVVHADWREEGNHE